MIENGKTWMRSQSMVEFSKALAFLALDRQRMIREFVVRAELGSKDGFAVIPESVDAVE
jgi:hypothetical protein